MKRQLLLIILHFLFFYKLNAQEFVWAKQMGGNSFDNAYSMAVDASGNLYITGDFNLTTDLDPGPGTFNLTSAGRNDIYVTKLNSSGNLIWAKRMGGIDEETALSVAVDKSGNVYATGQFEGTADFDPGPGTFNLTHTGDYSMFVSKLDASGNFKWAKHLTGNFFLAAGQYICLDASENVIITGRFKGMVDFDPGVGVFNLSSFGENDVFLLKLDASGNFIWAKQMGGPFNDYGLASAIDDYGNIYTTGQFRDTSDFDPGPDTFKLIALKKDDIFISKLDSSGKFVWAKQTGGDGNWDDDMGTSIIVDRKGDIIITGQFRGTSDFNPGPDTFTFIAQGGTDVFVLKLDNAGNFKWAKQMGGILSGAHDIATDAFGNLYTTGRFQYSGDFNPGKGTVTLTSTGKDDVFLSKLDTEGNFVWAKQMGGSTGNDRGNSIVVDNLGNVYTTGFFYIKADFDPGLVTFNLIGESYQIFIHKMGQCQTVGTDYRTACDSLKWIDGKTYTSSNKTASHILKNSKGCDSLVLLDLQINQSVFKTAAKTACDSFNWNGKIYEQSGDYLFRYQASTGCDSNVTLNLKINRSNDTTLHRTACKLFGFNDQVYTTDGKYFLKLKNHQGCDSLIELNLNIVTLDTSITRVGNTLFAIDSTATYQWVDCDDNYVTIPGATQKSFMPGKDGRYAVIVSSPPCIDTTSCVSIVLTQTKSSARSAVFIYPNPASTRIHLKIPEQFSGEKWVMIRDIHGRSVLEKLFAGDERSDLNLDISSFPAGLYYLSLRSASGAELVTFLKM